MSRKMASASEPGAATAATHRERQSFSHPHSPGILMLDPAGRPAVASLEGFAAQEVAA